MSLDVYLRTNQPQPISPDRRIFIREDGQTKQITRDEWDERFPDREPLTASPDESSNEVYSANITHNLGKMAGEAGIYYALWHPGELLDLTTAALIRAAEAIGNYHDAGGVYELERALPTPHARDLIAPLATGLALLESDPERFKAFNPANRWGDYSGLVRFVRDYLAACKEYPDAMVEVSR